MKPRILCIGGMDSSGGAGLLRDSATVEAMGGTACVAVTAVTAQNDHAVTANHPVPEPCVAAQIAAAGQVQATKIGMIGTQAIARLLARSVGDGFVVLDPVVMSSSGHSLMDPGTIDVLMSDLLPKVDLITPNLPELSALARHVGEGGEAPLVQARALLQAGVGAVLVKGGHGTGDHSVDTLVTRTDPPRNVAAPRIDATLRGTGCRLAAAIACAIAKGARLETAIQTGKAHVHAALLDAARGSPLTR